jgi:hypothetical protein
MFDVFGPFKIPVSNEKSGRLIPREGGEFWESCPEFATKLGCYLFAVRAGRGYKPIYVGKTSRNFQKECFALHKLDHYHRALVKRGRGTAVMFFVIPELRRGRANAKVIKDLESFLIQNASVKNPSLSNVQERKEAKWGIRGVIRGGKGKSSRAAREFKRGIGI